MRAWIAFSSILAKDIRTYYLKPPNISWGVIFPFAWMLMFFLRAQVPFDIRALLPGVMAMSILFGTTSMLAVTITFERKNRSFDRLLAAPLSLTVLMLAKTAGAILFGIGNAFIPLLFAALMTDLSGISWLPLAGSVILLAVTSTFLGLFIAVSVSEVFEAQTFSNFFRFPMIFLCGMFIPLEALPVYLSPLSYALPPTYGVDILKTAVNGEGTLPLWLAFTVLLALALLLFAASTSNIKRRWIL